MRVHFRPLFLLVFIIRSSTAADRVRTEEGGIVLENSSGQKTVLTQTGRDSDPWITSDGRTIVFLRQSAEDTFRNSVFEIDLPTRTPRLLYAGPVKHQGREISYFGHPELNESHDKLFLISKAYATEGALVSIRLPSGEAKLISDHVVGYDVVECPKKYRDDLIVLKRHEEDILGRPYFLYYLYSAAGSELGLAGDGELLAADLDFIRDGTCEEPEQQPLPIPSRPTRPPAENAVWMNEDEMDRQLITRVKPLYPSQAELEHLQGDVRLLVRVAADGTVQDVSLVSGLPQLAGAAVAAVKQWRYRPVISLGHPVAVVTIVRVPFRLPVTAK